MKSIQIGQRLKAIRQSRNMTLDDAAAATGVSKPMLGQIERGQSSPTVNTLWKISTGLKIPFSSFLQEQDPEYAVIDTKKEEMVTEEDGAMRAYTVFAFDPVHSYEVFFIELDPGCLHHSEKHDAGVAESVVVTHGTLDMHLNGTKITLNENQAIRFQADIPHAYLNPYEKMCCIYNTIFYH